jgi:hypothetical protein
MYSTAELNGPKAEAVLLGSFRLVVMVLPFDRVLLPFVGLLRYPLSAPVDIRTEIQKRSYTIRIFVKSDGQCVERISEA